MQQDPFTLTPMVEKDEPVFSTWKKYDVFLSFRGTDTRRTFVSHLYHELKTVRGIETFKDDRKMQMGDCIDETLLQAIEDSHFAIVVLSENYAESAWCLDELTKICEFMGNESRILPLFYYIEPNVVRHQTEKFKKAFEDHKIKGRHSEDKIKQWRIALKKVADISGCSTTEHNCDREVINHIVESLCKKLQTIKSCPLISLREFELFNATQETMDKVMKALKIQNVVSVGVWGKAGIGKTTMVEHIAAKVKKEGLFKYVAMSVISRKPNLWEIQERLAAMLGLPLTSTTEYERAKSLKSKIRSEDSILIILDNIWSDIMSDIGIPSFDELKNCNSKVLLITQEMNVLSEFECQRKITMSFLSERDSWRLLEKHTGKYFEQETKLYKAASKIIRECEGLPIALKTVAKTLTGKSLEQWRATARQLKASHNSLTKGMGYVYECIKVSYDYLDKDHQICFLLCCLFPEGYDIRIEDLLKYRIGKGLFEESDMLAARESICSVVRSLKEHNLLLDSKTDGRCARMHNVIRDVGLSISLSEHGHKQFFVRAGCQLEKWPTIYEHEYYTAFSLVRNSISNLPNDFIFPQLQILLLQSCFVTFNQPRDIPACLFQNLEALRVLDISQNWISFLPFPSTILSSLHTLCLDRCLSSHSNMSFLGQLKQLQILSMREYPDKMLPEEVGQLTKLKLLDFTSVPVEIVPSFVIGNLKDLEELYMQCDFADWESSDLGEMDRTKACFEEVIGLPLRILNVFISDAASMPRTVKIDPGWKNFDIWIVRDKSVRRRHLDSIDQSVRGHHLDSSSSSLVYSRALTLDINIDTLPKWFVDFVVKKTQKLQYMGCPELSNILSEYGSRRLHKLKYLSVAGPNEKMQEFMSVTRTQNEPVFENLEELHLDQLDGMEKLCAGELPTESLISLRLLTVMRCHKLKTVLESNILQRLQKLEKLSCKVMDKLEYVVSSEELEQSTLPELKEMRLDNLINLIRISRGPASCKIFDHVKVLAVNQCKELKHLFTYAEAEHLHNLEDLSIEACQRMESVIAASEEPVSNEMVLPKLMKLELLRLKKLTRFYGSTGNNTNDEENIEFPSLQHSFVDRCMSFQSPARKIFDSIVKQPTLKFLQTIHRAQSGSY